MWTAILLICGSFCESQTRPGPEVFFPTEELCLESMEFMRENLDPLGVEYYIKCVDWSPQENA